MRATKTLRAIDDAIQADGGSLFRKLQGETIPQCHDAYDPDNTPFRSHLGASLAGHKCGRYLWYSFHWTTLPDNNPRMLRLWNRGHLEEGRFVALLRMIGVQVYQYDSNGNQFRVAGSSGHTGGSCDGVAVGVPDLPEIPALAEFKTHNNKSFEKLVSQGLKESKYQHYSQMQVYGVKMRLSWGLYMAVNKDTEELYGEIVEMRADVAEHLETRIETIVYMPTPPPKISNRASWHECKFCDHARVCHYDEAPAKNCRTCDHAAPTPGGVWWCRYHNAAIPKATQLVGCYQYIVAAAYSE